MNSKEWPIIGMGELGFLPYLGGGWSGARRVPGLIGSTSSLPVATVTSLAISTAVQMAPRNCRRPSPSSRRPEVFERGKGKKEREWK